MRDYSVAILVALAPIFIGQIGFAIAAYMVLRNERKTGRERNAVIKEKIK